MPRLRLSTNGADTVREDTPERHRSKKGTPTMGGVIILTAILASTLLWANLVNRYVWVVMLAVAGFVIGSGVGLYRFRQEVQHGFGRPAQPHALGADHQRAVEKDRMRLDGIEQLRIGQCRIAKAQLGERRALLPQCVADGQAGPGEELRRFVE